MKNKELETTNFKELWVDTIREFRNIEFKDVEVKQDYEENPYHKNLIIPPIECLYNNSSINRGSNLKINIEGLLADPWEE